MKRRHFLQAVTTTGLGLALNAGANDAFTRFSASSRREPWRLGWANVVEDDFERAATLTSGSWPSGLRGVLYRNGPGRFERDGFRYHHWFDGDGLVHAWRIGADGVSHEARFVRTRKFEREDAVDRFLVDAIGTRIPDALPPRDADSFNTANTAVAVINGELLALWEGASAWKLDPATLETQGIRSWGDGLTGLPFSAHPLFDGQGRCWNFGLAQYLNGGTLILWQLERDGTLARHALLETGFPGYLHSFAQTRSHLVFVLNPMLWSQDDSKPFMERLQWQPEHGSRVLVVEKDTLQIIRRFDAPANMVYHWADARLDGNRIRLSGCAYADGRQLDLALGALMQGHPATDGGNSQLIEWSLDLTNGKLHETALPIHGIEFPVWDNRQASARFLFGPGSKYQPYANQLLALDRKRERLDRWDYGASRIVEEHLFVPEPGSSRDSHGWLIGTSLDLATHDNILSVFDARAIHQGPLAEARITRGLPLGFHGCFAAA